jgi:tetratricopeptide (TPR) repeat protein
LRLLAHTGVVGTALLAGYLIAGIAAGLRGRRRRQLAAGASRHRDPAPPAEGASRHRGPTPPAAALTATALLPLVVWLIYGSVDWFWEVPALSGPALGFLGMAAALSARSPAAEETPEPAAEVSTRPAGRTAIARGRIAGALGVLILLAAVVVLGFPYLSVRETSIGSDLGQTDPAKALHALSTAADLDPLSATPGRLAGYIALSNRNYRTARDRFEQAVSRDRGGWYAWLGAGLAESALGNQAQARRDFQVAAAINPRNAVIAGALAKVNTTRPLTPAAALQVLPLPS